MPGTGIFWDRRTLWFLLACALALPGCFSEPIATTPKAPAFAGIVLKVGAVDDPAILTGISLLQGEWEASRGGEITMVENVVPVKAALEADVVIFSGQRLGDLVDADALAVIPNTAVLPAKAPAPNRARRPGATSAPDRSGRTMRSSTWTLCRRSASR